MASNYKHVVSLASRAFWSRNACARDLLTRQLTETLHEERNHGLRIRQRHVVWIHVNKHVANNGRADAVRAERLTHVDQVETVDVLQGSREVPRA